MRRPIVVGLLAGLCGFCCAAETGEAPVPGAILISYVHDYQIEMLVGQYDPRRPAWLTDKHAFHPPDFDTPFTLFGPGGRLQEVKVKETSAADEQPWDWNVAISSWNRRGMDKALAFSGTWPELSRSPRRLSAIDNDIVRAVSQYLQEHKLNVSQPRITEAWQVDLNGDGQEEILVCANSDRNQLRNDAKEAIYAVSLLLSNEKGKLMALPLRSSMSYKPADRDLDEQQRVYGRFKNLQVLAVTDIAHDGHEQIAIVNDNRQEGPEVDLYSLQNNRIVHVLSARKIFL